jgi:hypothetical protein
MDGFESISYTCHERQADCSSSALMAHCSASVPQQLPHCSEGDDDGNAEVEEDEDEEEEDEEEEENGC